jgi:hypothetical protein
MRDKLQCVSQLSRSAEKHYHVTCLDKLREIRKKKTPQSKRQVIAPRSKPVTFTTQNLRARHCPSDRELKLGHMVFCCITSPRKRKSFCFISLTFTR